MVWMEDGVPDTGRRGRREEIFKQLPSGRSSAFFFLYHHPSSLNKMKSQPASLPTHLPADGLLRLMQQERLIHLLPAKGYTTYDTIQQHHTVSQSSFHSFSLCRVEDCLLIL